jgi:hypothetical protein
MEAQLMELRGVKLRLRRTEVSWTLLALATAGRSTIAALFEMFYMW